MKPRMLIISAPSGAGKSSFVDRLVKDFPVLRDTVTYTTRGMRRGESEGKPYHFVSGERFKQLLDEDFFVEWAQVHGNFYGTPMQQLTEAWAKGEVIIMDVDVQGAETFKKKYPDAATVFVIPPSIEELKRRIIKRDGKIPEDLEVRMRNAEREMRKSDWFDFKIVNDDFERSYAEFKRIVEELLARR